MSSTKEHKEFDSGGECPSCIAPNGGGVCDKVPGSPSTSIAIDKERPIAATFGYNTKDPAIQHHHREREGGY